MNDFSSGKNPADHTGKRTGEGAGESSGRGEPPARLGEVAHGGWEGFRCGAGNVFPARKKRKKRGKNAKCSSCLFGRWCRCGCVHCCEGFRPARFLFISYWMLVGNSEKSRGYRGRR